MTACVHAVFGEFYVVRIRSRVIDRYQYGVVDNRRAFGDRTIVQTETLGESVIIAKHVAKIPDDYDRSDL